MHEYENLCEFIKNELKELDRKVVSGNKLSTAEIQYGDLLSHFKKSLLTNEAMEEYDDGHSYADGMMYDDRSYARGARWRNSYGRQGAYANQKRDRMGRYARGGAYADDDFMEDLRELMEDAPNDHKRQKIQKLIDEFERM